MSDSSEDEDCPEDEDRPEDYDPGAVACVHLPLHLMNDARHTPRITIELFGNRQSSGQTLKVFYWTTGLGAALLAIFASYFCQIISSILWVVATLAMYLRCLTCVHCSQRPSVDDRWRNRCSDNKTTLALHVWIKIL